MISGYFIGSAVEVPAADVSPPFATYPRYVFTPVPSPSAIARAPVVQPLVETWPLPTVDAPRHPQIDQDARSIVKPTPRSTPPARGVTTSGGSHSVKGQASYYCSPSAPICHYKYPPGSMVAAACGKLRNAMGSDWRGQTVTVTGSGESVAVKLVDWCGSSDKLIDLYAAPFSQLAPLSAGVVRVTVSW